MINALYVEKDGVYFDLPGVIPWDAEKDARSCRNRAPAICHPPCERWGRYWGGGPMLHGTERQKLLGDDDGCFAHALWYVRQFGGVIEHPEASHAWSYYGLNKPPRKGGWIKADNYGGLTCCVEQGNYGHRARKATWLYINKIEPIELKWGKAEGNFNLLDEGFHSKEERARKIKTGICQRLSRNQRATTPEPFRDLLLKMTSLSVP